MRSKIGFTFLALYILACAYLIATQGVFGESFIVIILGMPWSLALSLIEYGGTSGTFFLVLIFLPLVLNGAILYIFGAFIGWLGRYVLTRLAH